MEFKGYELHIGDIVVFTCPTVPDYVQAAVIDVRNGRLEVLSAKEPLQAVFAEEEVDRLAVIYTAEYGIYLGARGFTKNQRVRGMVDGQPEEGKIVAAIEGHIVVERDDRQLVVGNAGNFCAATA